MHQINVTYDFAVAKNQTTVRTLKFDLIQCTVAIDNLYI